MSIEDNSYLFGVDFISYPWNTINGEVKKILSYEDGFIILSYKSEDKSVYEEGVRVFMLKNWLIKEVKLCEGKVSFRSFNISKNGIISFIPQEKINENKIYFYDLKNEKEIQGFEVNVIGRIENIKLSNEAKFLACNCFKDSDYNYSIYDIENKKLLSEGSGDVNFFSNDNNFVYVSQENKLSKNDFINNKIIKSSIIKNNLNYISIKASTPEYNKAIFGMHGFGEVLVQNLENDRSFIFNNFYRIINIDWLDKDGKLLIYNEEYNNIKIGLIKKGIIKKDSVEGINLLSLNPPYDKYTFKNLIVNKENGTVLFFIGDGIFNLLAQVKIEDLLKKFYEKKELD